MKLACPIGCSTNCYHGFDLETALRGIADAGFQYVELTSVTDYTEHVMPERMTGKDREVLVAKLKDYGLAPMSISGHSDLTSQNGVEIFKHCIDFAQQIGATIVNTGVGEVESREGKGAFFNNIHEIVEYATHAEVTVALETHGGLMGTRSASAEIFRKID